MSTHNVSTDGGASIGNDANPGRDFIGRDQHISTQVNIHSDGYIGEIWHLLDGELQDALSLAYNQACREGHRVIQTRYLFAALVRLKPDRLSDIFNEIPHGGLPKPIESIVNTTSDILLAKPSLSNCIADSLGNLTPKVSVTRKLSSTDVFIDIAKHGTGSSVKQLRSVGVSEEVVDKIVEEYGVSVVSR